MADKKTSPKTLVEALCEFQKHHHAAGLDGDNPFFKSKYTTLAQALSAIQPATEYGLCHSQLNEYEILPDGQILNFPCQLQLLCWTFLWMFSTEESSWSDPGP